MVLSWRALSVATLKFESSLQHRRAFKIQEFQTQLENNNMICVSSVGRARNWFFHCFHTRHPAISLVHIPKEANHSATYTISETEGYHQMSKVLWTWSTRNGAIFYGCMGVWLFAPYPDVSNCEDMSIVPSKWQGEIRSPAHFVFGGCTSCRLVIEAKRSRDEERYWLLKAIKLLDNSDETKRVLLKFKFSPDPPLRASPLLRIDKASLFPFSSSLSNAHCKSMCEEHYLILQLGMGVLIFKLASGRQDGFAVLSGPLHSLCPEGRSWADVSSIQPSMACANFDHLLYVGMLADPDTLTVWNLENGRRYSSKIVPPSGVLKLFVLDVGELYSVIGLVLVKHKLEIMVLSTATGRHVHSFGVPIFEDTTCQDTFTSSHCWLNSITRIDDLFEFCMICSKYRSLLCSL